MKTVSSQEILTEVMTTMLITSTASSDGNNEMSFNYVQRRERRDDGDIDNDRFEITGQVVGSCAKAVKSGK